LCWPNHSWSRPPPASAAPPATPGSCPTPRGRRIAWWCSPAATLGPCSPSPLTLTTWRTCFLSLLLLSVPSINVLTTLMGRTIQLHDLGHVQLLRTAASEAGRGHYQRRRQRVAGRLPSLQWLVLAYSEPAGPAYALGLLHANVRVVAVFTDVQSGLLTWVVCSASSVRVQQSGLAGNLLAPFSNVHIQNAQVHALSAQALE
jgi:hypothetical protein